MTAPRQVLPGTTCLVTRRCSQRQLLLRPSQETNQTVGYLLALAASRFQVEVHAFCVMSNHLHLVVSDPEARLPAFTQFFDSLVARSMNAWLARWENFWAPTSYSAVALHGPADVVDKSAYVLANPVAAGLVRRGRSWPPRVPATHPLLPGQGGLLVARAGLPRPGRPSRLRLTRPVPTSPPGRPRRQGGRRRRRPGFAGTGIPRRPSRPRPAPLRPTPSP